VKRTSLLLGKRTSESTPHLVTLYAQAFNTHAHIIAIMAGSGVNLATTRDGGTYNKLQRPDDYLMSSTTAPPPAKAILTDALSSTYAGKRKRENDDDASSNQRMRLGKDAGEVGKPRYESTSKERSRVTDCGMRTMLPGLDDEGNSSDDGIGEALAYLRDVR
jgi:hypothetical protein